MNKMRRKEVRMNGRKKRFERGKERKKEARKRLEGREGWMDVLRNSCGKV